MNLPYDENEEIEEIEREKEEQRARKERERKLKEAGKQNKAMSAGQNSDVLKVFLCMMVCLLLLVALMYGGLLLLERNRAVAENPDGGDTSPVISTAIVYTQEEMEAKIAEAEKAAMKRGSENMLDTMKVSFASGMSTIDILRAMYPDDLVVGSGGRFFFHPIDRSLRQNELVAENLSILESGEYQYLQDGAVISHKGIDVSSHQGAIDWNQVAADGVEFAFVRAVFRGYGSGKLVEDEQFDANMQGAIAAGVKVGVYVFSQAINEEEILEEANLVLEKVAPYQLDCPIVFDVEMVSGDGRMNYLSAEERTSLVLLFCKTIEESGHRVMIYHNTEMAAVKVNIAALEQYDKWYASYSSKMFYPYEYRVWQYSDKGKVQGIKGDVDMNLCVQPVWE